MKKSQNSVGADKLKGVLVTRTAIKTLTPEDIVERVIMFQFKDARDQVHTYEQIEISGFGKFITSPLKIRRKLEKMERILTNMERLEQERTEELSDKKLEYWNKRMENNREIITYLKTRSGGYETKS